MYDPEIIQKVVSLNKEKLYRMPKEEKLLPNTVFDDVGISF